MRMPGARPNYPQPAAQEADSLSSRVSSSLRAFHVHARDCRHCIDPYAVYKSPTRQLCDDGHNLAQEIAVNLYSKARTTPQGMIEVTFPAGWESVDGLIRAITHKLQGEPTNCINIAVHDAYRASTSSLAREAATTGKIYYVPASGSEPINRGSAYARDVSHRTGDSRRHSSQRESSSSHRRSSSDPRTSSISLIEARRSPSPSSTSSRDHTRRIEEAPRQQLIRTNSMRQSGPRVAFNPEVETRYF